MITPDEQNWESMEKEIELFIKEVNSELERNPEIRDLCKGWEVWFSPIILNPTIMFIGINPGDGAKDDYTYIDLDPKNKFQYLDKNFSNVGLAKDTIEVFKNINAFHLLAKSVKTNYYYIITTRAYPAITDITTYLERNKSKDALGDRFYSNAIKWTKQLIEELIEPKIIICEGMEAYKQITDLYIGRRALRNDCESIFIDDINAWVVGYKRTSFGRINNKLTLQELLKELLLKLYIM